MDCSVWKGRQAQSCFLSLEGDSGGEATGEPQGVYASVWGWAGGRTVPRVLRGVSGYMGSGPGPAVIITGFPFSGTLTMCHRQAAKHRAQVAEGELGVGGGSQVWSGHRQPGVWSRNTCRLTVCHRGHFMEKGFERKTQKEENRKLIHSLDRVSW